MTSLPVRDRLGDRLLTPQNSALILIDYQPSQFGAVRSMDAHLLLKNIVSRQDGKGLWCSDHPLDGERLIWIAAADRS
jgi:hypothetical protein